MLIKTCWTPLSSDNRNVCAKPVLLFVNMVAVATGNLRLLGEKRSGRSGGTWAPASHLQMPALAHLPFPTADHSRSLFPFPYWYWKGNCEEQSGTIWYLLRSWSSWLLDFQTLLPGGSGLTVATSHALAWWLDLVAVLSGTYSPTLKCWVKLLEAYNPLLRSQCKSWKHLRQISRLVQPYAVLPRHQPAAPLGAAPEDHS